MGGDSAPILSRNLQTFHHEIDPPHFVIDGKRSSSSTHLASNVFSRWSKPRSLSIKAARLILPTAEDEKRGVDQPIEGAA